MLHKMMLWLLLALMTLKNNSQTYMYHLTGSSYNLLKGNPLSDEYNDYFADPGFIQPIFSMSF